nr:MAG TPA: hypothetical protein [Caudoviricetes sp.]
MGARQPLLRLLQIHLRTPRSTLYPPFPWWIGYRGKRPDPLPSLP